MSHILLNRPASNSLFCFMQKRYLNRPIVEFEIAAQEQMKVTELRLAKLFSSKIKAASTIGKYPTISATNAEGTNEINKLLRGLVYL